MGILHIHDQKNLLLTKRWPWHLLFWTGYALFRFWMYYLTVAYYPAIFLRYMLLSEVLFAGATYFTLWLYRRLFAAGRYPLYFTIGAAGWIAYLIGRTLFQFWYLRGEPRFRGNTVADIFINNITVVIVAFLFVTACKYFKDGFIAQQWEAARKQQQLEAEVNNLKSQIAPHFLFNTLNNLYGLAVDKSDKLPGLMLQLSDLLRHSLYETQKPLVPLPAEIAVLRSYIQLERIRLEDDLRLQVDDRIPADAPQLIAPLILIVFLENAFKHAKLVQGAPVTVRLRTALEGDWLLLNLVNNYNPGREASPGGIGLVNVKRRLDILYPGGRHELQLCQDGTWFEVSLRLQLVTKA
ncbi:MAG: histidine kinase [Chitinophagaceae bacterium]|nr:MAG: histidine kinase [Chitinophagaceae bacterium]